MTAPVTQTPPATAPTAIVVEPDLVAEDLIEEVSIDGMCGVY